MAYVKDFLVSLLVVALLLCATAFDDSYEDSTLSAQVLDEAIAQAFEKKQTTDRVVSIYQDEAIKH